MKGLIYALCGLAASVACLMAAPVRAQTAYDINRLNAAMQICNSPAGATMAECAQLRARMGMSAGPTVNLPGGGLSGLAGGNKAQAAAGILGLLSQARPAAAAAAAPPTPAAASPGIGIDINRAISNCVARAAGDQAQIDRCLAIANGGVAPPR